MSSMYRSDVLTGVIFTVFVYISAISPLATGEHSDGYLIKAATNLEGRSFILPDFGGSECQAWPEVVRYRVHPLFANALEMITDLLDGIDFWEIVSCARLQNNQTDYDFEILLDNTECSSNLGRDCTVQNPVAKFAQSCINDRPNSAVVMHHIARTLGVNYQSNRPDRNHYIRIHWPNIPENRTGEFRRHYASQTFNIPYDYCSLMHLPSNSTPGGELEIETLDPTFQDVIGEYEGATFNDIRLVNEALKCAEKAGCDTTNMECPITCYMNQNCLCYCPEVPTQTCTYYHMSSLPPETPATLVTRFPCDDTQCTFLPSYLPQTRIFQTPCFTSTSLSYTPGVTCSESFQVNEPYHVVFNTFDLELIPECGDLMRITTEQCGTFQLCSGVDGSKVILGSGKIDIEFQSDMLPNMAAGVQASFYPLALDCRYHARIDANYNIIFSLPTTINGLYGNNNLCEFTIYNDRPAHLIKSSRLSFKLFGYDFGVPCNDHLLVDTTGERNYCTEAPTLVRVCGRKIFDYHDPLVIKSTGRVLTILFVTDGSDQSSGITGTVRSDAEAIISPSD